MTTLNEIEAKAKAYAAARATLADYVAELNAGLDALKRENLPRVKRALARAADLQSELQALVAAAPQHFVKPRTLVLHGIKVGYEKGKGTIVFEDAEQVVALIDKKLPDLADMLVRTERKPLKTALAQLTVQQLKAIGCQVQEAGDQVVVRAVDAEVDKLVAALLKGAEVEQTV